MPLPLLELLPATARAAYPYIVAATRRGLSSRQIETFVRAEIGPISRGRSILPLMRAIRERDAIASSVRFIPKGRTINVDRLPASLTTIRRNYSFTVHVSGRDLFGRLIEREVTVTTDRRSITPGEIEEAARELVSEGGQSPTLTEVGATLQSGIRRADFPV